MSETLLRIISGISIAVIYVFFFMFGSLSYLPLFLFICFINVVVIKEFYGLFLKKSEDGFVWISGYIFSTLILSAIYLDSIRGYTGENQIEFISSLSLKFPDSNFLFGYLVMFYIILVGSFHIFRSRLQDSLHATSIGLFGLLYIPFTISFIFKLRGLNDGVFYIWFLSTITVMTDVGGYFVGKYLGRHKVNLAVSPKKTWEGYIGAFFIQMMSSFIFYHTADYFFEVPVFQVFEIIAVSILIYCSSVFGDLFESLIKRNASAKDSGNFLPGHGGLLDRIDSIMFSLPIFYIYLMLFR